MKLKLDACGIFGQQLMSVSLAAQRGVFAAYGELKHGSQFFPDKNSFKNAVVVHISSTGCAELIDVVERFTDAVASSVGKPLSDKPAVVVVNPSMTVEIFREGSEKAVSSNPYFVVRLDFGRQVQPSVVIEMLDDDCGHRALFFMAEQNPSMLKMFLTMLSIVGK